LTHPPRRDLGSDVDHAMLIKSYGQDSKTSEEVSQARNYSPQICTGLEVRGDRGQP
jgi:hypothetical protein